MPLPPTTQKQRELFYEDIEALLLPGFLYHPVVVQDTPMCLRTLGPGDMFALHARMSAPGAEWRAWTVASSIWMVNGINLLGEPGAVPRLAAIVRGFPKNIQDILFTIVIGLFARQKKASRGVESFCYETQSRYQWRSMGGNAFSAHVGVPGAEKLGTNLIQRMWVAYNTFEDQREDHESLWEGFKLSASAMAPKGIQKLDNKDRERRKREDARRSTVQDYFYYWTLGLLNSPDPKKAKGTLAVPGNVLIESKSADELAEEMRRWVSGEEDWHDKVIREYKKRIIERIEGEKAEQARHLAAVQAEAAERGEDLLPSTALVGYTADQLAAIIGERQAGSPGVKQVATGGEQRNYLYSKYIEKAPTAGNLRVDGEHLVVAGQEESPLAADLAGRQVTFSKGND